MNKLAALLVVLGLSACACPRTESYEDTPYDGRTAGSGMVEQNSCWSRIWD